MAAHDPANVTTWSDDDIYEAYWNGAGDILAEAASGFYGPGDGGLVDWAHRVAAEYTRRANARIASRPAPVVVDDGAPF
jgi:hypothetical protein